MRLELVIPVAKRIDSVGAKVEIAVRRASRIVGMWGTVNGPGVGWGIDVDGKDFEHLVAGDKILEGDELGGELRREVLKKGDDGVRTK